LNHSTGKWYDSNLELTDQGVANMIEKSSLVKHAQRMGSVIIVTGAQAQPLEMMRKTGLFEQIGARHFFDHTGDAINYALTWLDYNQCLGCTHLAFRECESLSNEQ
jgi:SulP family sulfate permease